MQDVAIAGFWSYTQQDDDRDGGRLLWLADLLANEFVSLTGSQLDVFVKRDSSKWGAEWHLRVETAPATATFFIPVITPSYFKSEECRQELLQFVGHARGLGAEDLVLPLLYIDVPELHADEPGDEAVAAVKARQWQDFRGLRPLAESDPASRRQRLDELARRLIEIEKSLPSTLEVRYRPDSGDAKARTDSLSEEQEWVEVFAEAADAARRCIEAIEALPTITDRFGALADKYGGKLSAAREAGESFAVTLRITRQFVNALCDQADELLRHGQEYSVSIVALDRAVSSLARIVEQDLDDATSGEFHGFVLLIRELAAQARETIGRLEVLVQAFDEARKMSREVRPPIEMMKQGVLQLIDGQAVLDKWELQLANLLDGR